MAADQARRLVVVDEGLIENLNHLLSCIETVFGDPDWEVTRENITCEFLIAPHGTFLEPGVKDESDNWGNRGALLTAYRELNAILQEPQIRILDDPAGLRAYHLAVELNKLKQHGQAENLMNVNMLSDLFLGAIAQAKRHERQSPSCASNTAALISTISLAWDAIVAKAETLLAAERVATTPPASKPAPEL